MSPDQHARVAPSSILARRFGSKAARFRTAVALGFIIATVGFVAAGPGSRASLAEEGLWGPLSTLFGLPPAPAYRANVAAADTRRPRHRWAAPRRGIVPVPVRSAALAGERSVCVRLCDGYVFPVGSYRGDADRATHRAICQSACPDAQTALYMLPAGSDGPGGAVNLATGQTYSDLPDAFHYTTVLDDACTCHRAGSKSRTLSLLRDFTLRRGDAVMTPAGVKVFHGGGRFPYRRDDFVALARSHDIRNAERATIGAIERASLRPPAGTQPGGSGQPSGAIATGPAGVAPSAPASRG